MSLSPRDQERLVNVLNRLASNHDGERAAAGLLASRLIKASGETWDSLLRPMAVYSPRPAPEPSWNRGPAPSAYDRPLRSAALIATACLRNRNAISSWEADFLVDMVRRRAPLSPKQSVVLERIALRLGISPYAGGGI